MEKGEGRGSRRDWWLEREEQAGQRTGAPRPCDAVRMSTSCGPNCRSSSPSESQHAAPAPAAPCTAKSGRCGCATGSAPAHAASSRGSPAQNSREGTGHGMPAAFLGCTKAWIRAWWWPVSQGAHPQYLYSHIDKHAPTRLFGAEVVRPVPVAQTHPDPLAFPENPISLRFIEP